MRQNFFGVALFLTAVNGLKLRLVGQLTVYRFIPKQRSEIVQIYFNGLTRSKQRALRSLIGRKNRPAEWKPNIEKIPFGPQLLSRARFAPVALHFMAHFAAGSCLANLQNPTLARIVVERTSSASACETKTR